ncbi:hypothetical protein Pfo_024496 [Paulownia fortunei]|nr:hypothetical protein Pfo_024496 [Paulownia fortunei]
MLCIVCISELRNFGGIYFSLFIEEKKENVLFDCNCLQLATGAMMGLQSWAITDELDGNLY